MAIQDSTDSMASFAGGSATPLGGKTKRAFDIVASVCAIIVLMPLLLLVSFVIFVFEGGPVIIRHTRIGQGGERFSCYKFRTMVVNGDEVLRSHLSTDPDALREWTVTRKLTNDPRVTQLGRILRKSSIDELPQLFNIFAGDMSFVGPRPIVEEEITRYGRAFELYRLARPGLTGKWQISGRNDTEYSERIELDREYVVNWSFMRDLAIIFLTIPAVVKARGVY